jgi:acetyl-CoA carboxylase biotin carboxyl carrier protein
MPLKSGSSGFQRVVKEPIQKGESLAPKAITPVKRHQEIRKEVRVVTEITAPMGGKVLDVKVKPGDKVNEDDEVIILEAMKMELPVVATTSGTVKEVRCNTGDAVEADAVLVIIE